MSSFVTSCSLCKDGDTSKQLVTEDQALEHLGEHSKFFLKKSSKYLKITCRVCGGPISSSDETAVSEHFDMFHPIDCFASREDFEDQSASIQEVSSKSRWDSSDNSDSEAEADTNGNELAGEGSDVSMSKTDADSEKQDNVNPVVEPINSITELDQGNQNDNDVHLKPKINKPESVSSESNETETSEPSKEMDSARIQQLANHLGSVEQEIISTNENKSQKVNFNVTFGDIRKSGERSLYQSDRYTAVLIPLPFISFSRRHKSVYKCTVCPGLTTTSSYYQMLQHREKGTLIIKITPESDI